MHIKRFEAPDMPAALRMIKQEFGSEAVILSAKNCQQDRGLLGFLKKPGVEVTAAIDKGHERENARIPASMTDPTERLRASKVYTRGGLLQGVKQELEPYGTRASSRKNDGMPLQENNSRLFALYNEMIAQEVDEHAAAELVKKVRWSAEPEDIEERTRLKECLVRIIENTGMVGGAVNVSGRKRRVIALVGPTGVGKTTTIAKLAVQYAHNLSKQVALITTDTKRIGALDQIKTYARIINVALETANDREELRKALNRTNDADLVLIDTAGVGRYDGGRFRELTALFDGIRPLEIHLVLSATTKERDVPKIMQQYRAMTLNRLIISKVDETNTCGHMVRHLMETDIPLSFITNGQNVARDIAPATAGTIVEWITDETASRGVLKLKKNRNGTG